MANWTCQIDEWVRNDECDAGFLIYEDQKMVGAWLGIEPAEGRGSYQEKNASSSAWLQPPMSQG